jgi:hypothetical protein
MPDILLSSVAASLGLDEDKLRRLLAEANVRSGPPASAPEANRAIAAYYPDQELERSNFLRYAYLTPNGRTTTWLAASPAWRRLRISAQDSAPAAALLPNRSFPPAILEDELAPYLARIIQGNARNWDNRIYRLVEMDVVPHRAGASFTLDTYLRYRFTSGLMADELFRRLAESPDGTVPRSALPLRARWLPDAASLGRFEDRICAGGVNVLVALARPKPEVDYALFLHQRSGLVSEGQGSLSVIPMGYHEPMHDPSAEVSPAFTVFRKKVV